MPNIESPSLTPGNFVRPEEAPAWEALTTSFRDSLAPSGPLETFLVAEIASAAWRIHRCNNVEAGLIDRLSNPSLDPMEDPATRDAQNAVDRARTQAERSMERSMTALRRLQNARPPRAESVPETSVKPIQPAIRTHATPPAASPENEAGTPRNSPCPCGSGQKHKRCCGRNAPPVLGFPLPRAA